MLIKNKPVKIFNASKMKVGMAVARFNHKITEQLLKSALKTLREFKIKDANIKIISVAGSAEIPFALATMAKTNRFDCLAALGCVIKGETPHFDYVCKMAQEGILRVSLDYGIPIGFGVITANNLRQAKARINLGGDAAEAALELAKLKI